MTQSLASPDPLLFTIVLATLAIGLPILFVFAIRFLWDRNVNIGRSKELEKLIWQLHRIASALEHQMNLSFPAVQPGTEEARDLAYLKEIPAQPRGTAAVTNPTGAAPAVQNPYVQQPATQQAQAEQPAAVPPAAQPASAPGLELRDPSVDAPRAGVNSMFGL